MPYPFGKDITYTFYPVAEREFVSLSGVTTAPAIYVYKDGYKPSRTEAIAGTDNGGLIETITTWSDTSDGNGKTFTITAIDDPDPTAAEDNRTYWLAINFYLKDGEQVQTVLRALPLQRIYAHHKAISTSASDLEAIFPNIDTYIGSTAQNAAITTATTRTKIDLEALGFEWATMWRPDLLSTAVTYKALSQLAWSLSKEQGDVWQSLATEYAKTYKDITGGLKLEFINYQEQDPVDNEPQRAGGFMRVVR